jgi:hypothetical protein
MLATLDDGRGFALAPWQPGVEFHLGWSISAVVQREAVS